MSVVIRDIINEPIVDVCCMLYGGEQPWKPARLGGEWCRIYSPYSVRARESTKAILRVV